MISSVYGDVHVADDDVLGLCVDDQRTDEDLVLFARSSDHFLTKTAALNMFHNMWNVFLCNSSANVECSSLFNGLLLSQKESTLSTCYDDK